MFQISQIQESLLEKARRTNKPGKTLNDQIMLARLEE